ATPLDFLGEECGNGFEDVLVLTDVLGKRFLFDEHLNFSPVLFASTADHRLPASVCSERYGRPRARADARLWLSGTRAKGCVHNFLVGNIARNRDVRAKSSGDGYVAAQVETSAKDPIERSAV